MATFHQEKILIGSQNTDQMYQIWCSVVTQPSIQQLDPDVAKLFDAVAQIGYQHADSKNAYKYDIFSYLSRWNEKIISLGKYLSNDGSYNVLHNDTADTIRYDPSEILYISHILDTYDLSSRKKQLSFHNNPAIFRDEASNLQTKSLERQFSRYMKRVIPLSYAITFSVFLSLSLIFSFTFYIGLKGGNYFIGPWTNLMLLIAATGMEITVFVACGEWRSWQRGFREKIKPDKKQNR